MEKKTIYYLIRGRIIGKREWDSHFTDYLFKEGEWVPDRDCIILDHLMGYDPYEPPDSPYVIGNLDIMDKIEEISYSDVQRLIEEAKEQDQ